MSSPHPIENVNDVRTNVNLQFDIIPPLSGPLAKFDVVHPSMSWEDDLEPEIDECDSDLCDYFPVDFSSHSSFGESPPPVLFGPSVPSTSIESVTSLWLSPPTSHDTATTDPTHREVDDDNDYSDHPDLISPPEFPPFLSPHLTPRARDLTPTPTPAPTRTGSPVSFTPRSETRGYFDIHTRKGNTDIARSRSWNAALGNVQRRGSSLSPPTTPAMCPRTYIFGVVGVKRASHRSPVLHRKPARFSLREDYARDAFNSLASEGLEPSSPVHLQRPF